MMTVAPDTNEIIIDRGDDQTLRVTIRDSSGNILNVTGGSFKCTVKEFRDDPIGSAIFQLTNPTANGIDVTQAASGIIDITFPHNYIASMAGRYWYDVEMTLSGSVRTLIPATVFHVRKDVSTPGSVTNPTLPGMEFPGYVAINGALYMKDQTTGQWWKKIFENGQENTYGPSASIPF